jgi:hypothetical protein
LRRRVLLATHSFGAAMPPALVINAAGFTVEEAWLIGAYLSNRRVSAEALATLRDPDATPEQRRAASRRLVLCDAGGGGAPSGRGDGSGGGGGSDARAPSGALLRLAYETLDLALRSSSSVLVEAVFAAVGSFLWPGTGTWVLAALGASAVWVV